MLFGYTQAEILGRNVLEVLLDEADFDEAENILERFRSGEAWTGQMRLRKKSGEIFTAVVTDSPYFSDERSLQGIVEISYDVSSLPQQPTLSAGEEVIDEGGSHGTSNQQAKPSPFATISNLVISSHFHAFVNCCWLLQEWQCLYFAVLLLGIKSLVKSYIQSLFQSFLEADR